MYNQLIITALLAATAAGAPLGALMKRAGSADSVSGGKTSTASGGSPLASLPGDLGGLLGGKTSTTSGSSPFPSLPSLLGGLGGSATATAAGSSGLGGLASLLGGGSSTADGLGGACKSVTVIFARGTTELGSLGFVVGPGLATDLEADLKDKVAVQV